MHNDHSLNTITKNPDSSQGILESKILPEPVKNIFKNRGSKDNNTFSQLKEQSKKLASKTLSEAEVTQIGSRYTKNIKIPEHSAIKLRSHSEKEPRRFHASIHSDNKTITTQHVRNDNKNTMPEFFEAIFDNNVGVIKNLTNLSTTGKGDRNPEKNSSKPAFDYWPPKGEIKTHGSFQVKTTKIDKKDGYSVISMLVKGKKGKPKKTKIFHFENWPDHGVPTGQSLAQYKNYLAACDKYSAKMKTTSKTMIHCHAGVGRTGSQALLDKMKQDIDNGITTAENFEQHLYENLWELRQNGGSDMVQQEEQLKFVRDFALSHLQQKMNPQLTQTIQSQRPMPSPEPKETSQQVEIESDSEEEHDYVNFTPDVTPQGSPKPGIKTKQETPVQQEQHEESPYVNWNGPIKPEEQAIPSSKIPEQDHPKPKTTNLDAFALYDALPETLKNLIDGFLTREIKESQLPKKISQLSPENLAKLNAWVNQAKIDSPNDKPILDKASIHINYHLNNSNRPENIAKNPWRRPNDPVQS
ncbi:hypothetical protein [Endozoicomonas sp. Mp262]|uniref:protein-tyrosine phosphatase family protein n=1 Tax=Endozoicomonas sp. Mp262 TaxID=2919499 RepID=UPI0021E053F2